MIDPRRLALLLLLIASTAAWAHTLPVTGVAIHCGPRSTTVAVTVHLPLLTGADPATAIPTRLHLRLDAVPFHPGHTALQRDGQNDVALTARVRGRARSRQNGRVDDPADLQPMRGKTRTTRSP